MIFAFLYGISMDYEVFMITRMREVYDEPHDTQRAIELGLARTGKLVTSAALVLMFAFFSLSTSPGPDIKQFAIGLAAGDRLRRDGDPGAPRPLDDDASGPLELVAPDVDGSRPADAPEHFSVRGGGGGRRRLNRRRRAAAAAEAAAAAAAFDRWTTDLERL